MPLLTSYEHVAQLMPESLCSAEAAYRMSARMMQGMPAGKSYGAAINDGNAELTKEHNAACSKA